MAYTVQLAEGPTADVHALATKLSTLFTEFYKIGVSPYRTKKTAGVTLHDVRHRIAKPYYGNSPLEMVCKHCTEHKRLHTEELRCPYAASYFWPANLPSRGAAERPPRKYAFLSFEDWMHFNNALNATLNDLGIAANVHSKRYMPECECGQRKKGCQRFWIRHAPNLSRFVWDGFCGYDGTDRSYFLPPDPRIVTR